jgi:glycerol-1-phosphate dehydrogenase [NAD(P)+]
VPLLARMVPSPLSVDIRRGAVEGLAALLRDQRISSRGQVAVVVGPGQGEQIIAVVRPALQNADVYPVEGGTVEAAIELADSLRAGSYDAVVGIGGGRTLDVAKYAASLTGLPMVAVATSLAHDGIASPVASLDHDGHKGSHGVNVPIAVVVDLDYVRACPPEQLRGGVGDVLSNLSAVADWELANAERGEPFDGLAVALARSGAEALLYREDELVSDAFLTTLAEGLVLSGLAMAAAGSSRPCSGACHEISHAIDLLYPDRNGYHGEQVGLGAAFSTFLRKDEERLEQMVAALRWHGLPVVPDDLGFSVDDFTRIVLAAPQTRPGRHTILEELALSDEGTRLAVKDYIDVVSGPAWA